MWLIIHRFIMQSSDLITGLKVSFFPLKCSSMAAEWNVQYLTSNLAIIINESVFYLLTWKVLVKALHFDSQNERGRVEMENQPRNCFPYNNLRIMAGLHAVKWVLKYLNVYCFLLYFSAEFDAEIHKKIIHVLK